MLLAVFGTQLNVSCVASALLSPDIIPISQMSCRSPAESPRRPQVSGHFIPGWAFVLVHLVCPGG